MRILASDTSGKSLSVAVKDGDRLLFTKTLHTGGVHSTDHMPLIEKAMSESRLDYKDLDLLACTRGPGSYTGIRINIAAMKTLSYASGVGVIGLSVLESLAFPYLSDRIFICPLLDARNRRAFASLIYAEKTLLKEGNYSLRDYLEHVYSLLLIAEEGFFDSSKTSYQDGEIDMPDKILFLSPETDFLQTDPAYLEFFRRVKENFPHLALEVRRQAVEAANIASLARLRYEEGFDTDPFNLKAVYISPSQAERMKKHPNSSYELVEAVIEDADEIFRLETEGYPSPRSLEAIKKDFDPASKIGHLLVKENGHVRAFAGYSLVLDEGHLHDIVVEEGYRGKGLGRMLLRKIFELAEETVCKKIFLEVRTRNESAIHLYISEGFEAVRIRRGYYGDNGENALIMLKNL